MTTYSHTNPSTGNTMTITLMLDEDWGTPEPHVVLVTTYDANGRIIPSQTKRMTHADPAQAILDARYANEALTALFAKRKGGNPAHLLTYLTFQFLAVALVTATIVSFLFTIGG
jgi:hypothetical protein